MAPSLTAVVLAAGMGSRFGGDKQLAELGPNGETLFDYTIHDALTAGFERIVLIVRTEIEDQVVTQARRFQPDIEVVAALQDQFGPPRAKPWGTGHALLSAADAIEGPFAIVNADDRYGAGAFGALNDHFSSTDGQHAMVGFRLEPTLSPNGAVTRGLVEVGDDGALVDIRETKGVERTNGGVIDSDGQGVDPNTLASMNMWGFTDEIVDLIRPLWDEWLAAHAEDDGEEFLLPTVVGDLIAAGAASVRVLGGEAAWVGVTYREDVPAARAAIRSLIDAGEYPERLGP